MDIDDALEEWGTDIGTSCGILLNSDCSLTGGFYHVTRQSRNLWADIDDHLGMRDPYDEEPLDFKVPEPIPMFKYSPREASVSRYMHMDLEKTICPANAISKTLPQTNVSSLEIDNKEKMRKPGAPSTRNRPKSSGDSGTVNRPKFFRLGEYPGTRPFTTESEVRDIKEKRKLPYFPEIQLQHQTKMAAKVKVNKLCKMDSEEMAPTTGPALKNKALDTVYKPIKVREMLTDDMKAKPAKVKGRQTRQTDQTGSVKTKKVRLIHVKPSSDDGEDLYSDRDTRSDNNMAHYSDNKQKSRLRKALKGLQNRFRSLFSSCISYGQEKI